MDNNLKCSSAMQDYGRNFEKELEKMSPFEIKNKLISYAKDSEKRSASVFLNAGRGNPNWINTLPREAFFMLGRFGLSECRRIYDERDTDIASVPESEGMAGRLKIFLDAHKGCKTSDFIEKAFDYVVNNLNADADELTYEWVSGIIGDQYPSPDRILKYTEKVVSKYLSQEMCGCQDSKCASVQYDLFATEGGTAAMCYLFSTLKADKLLCEGDKIALMTPIFTPYIEIPGLAEFGLEIIEIRAEKMTEDGYHTWQYTDDELEKLKNPEIKLLCVVNPSNPPSYALDENSLSKIVEIVEKYNPNLMIITDDVYGTFVNNFCSLICRLPYNTACVYSFSKYFGCTGWRIAVTAVAEENVFDALLKQHSADVKNQLKARYENISFSPDEMKFIDRLVADSRLVALNHTAGLSTPQQIQMTLFALYALLDKDNVYKQRMQKIIKNRLEALWSSTGFELHTDPSCAGYYTEIDIRLWAEKLYGNEFSTWLTCNYEPLDFVIRLAKENGVVLLNGSGFDAPDWSVRVSLANLTADAYSKIGKFIGNLLEEYAGKWYTEG